MKMLQKLCAVSFLSTCAISSQAADYTDGDRHKNDFHWMHFKLKYTLKGLPRSKDAKNDYEYLSAEFGGRSGVLDLFGYVDIFNLTNSSSNDKYEKEKMFMKLSPRFSLDGLFAKDLSFGPVQELYFATLFEWGGGYAKRSDFPPTNKSFWGVGADVMFPWLGKIGLNLYGLYDLNKKAWNGYQISTNWFKPFHTFENKSFLSYQGYMDYQFGAQGTLKGSEQATNGGVWFNGLYWNSKHWAVGYGLKLHKDVYLIKDSDYLKSTGASHHFNVAYKL